jgi:hypothetical protein
VRTTGQECEFFLTNKGLHIQLVVTPLIPHIFTGYLNCSAHGHRIGIALRRISIDQYVRIISRSIERPPLPVGGGSDAGKMTTIYIAEPKIFNGISSLTDNTRSRGVTFSPSHKQCRDYGFVRVDIAEYSFFLQRKNKERNRYGEMNRWEPGASAFKFQHESNPNLRFIVAFGLTRDYHVWSDIELQIGGNEDLQEVVQSYCDNELRYVNERHQRRLCARDNMRDRITVPLANEPTRLFVNVALKKVLLSGRVCYKVDITIT